MVFARYGRAGSTDAAVVVPQSATTRLADLHKLLGEYAALEASLSEAKVRAARAEDRADSEAAARGALAARLRTLEDELRVAREQLTAGVAAARGETTVLKAELHDCRQSLAEALRGLEDRQRNVLAVREVLARREPELARLRDECDSARRGLEEALGRESEAQASLAATAGFRERLARRVAALDEEKETHLGDRAALEASLAEVKFQAARAEDRADSAAAGRDALAARVRSLEDEVRAAQERADAGVVAAQREAAVLASELHDCRQSLGGAVHSLEERQRSLLAVQEDVMRREHELERLRGECASAREGLEGALNREREVQARLADVVEDRDRLAGSVAALDNERETHLGDFAALEASLAEAKFRAARAEDRADSAAAGGDALAARVRSLENEVRTARAAAAQGKAAALTDELSEVRQSLAEAVRSKEEALAGECEVQARLADVVEDRDRLAGKVTALDEEKETHLRHVRGEMVAMAERVRVLDEELTAARDGARGGERQLEERDRELTTLKAEIEARRMSEEALRGEHDAALARLQAATTVADRSEVNERLREDAEARLRREVVARRQQQALHRSFERSAAAAQRDAEVARRELAAAVGEGRDLAQRLEAAEEQVRAAESGRADAERTSEQLAAAGAAARRSAEVERDAQGEARGVLAAERAELELSREAVRQQERALALREHEVREQEHDLQERAAALVSAGAGMTVAGRSTPVPGTALLAPPAPVALPPWALGQVQPARPPAAGDYLAALQAADEDDEPEEADDPQDGLDEGHRRFLAELAQREEWPEDEAARLAKDHGLLLRAALQQVNRAAESRFGDGVVELVDGVVSVDDVGGLCDQQRAPA